MVSGAVGRTVAHRQRHTPTDHTTSDQYIAGAATADSMDLTAGGPAPSASWDCESPIGRPGPSTTVSKLYIIQLAASQLLYEAILKTELEKP